MKGGYEMK